MSDKMEMRQVTEYAPWVSINDPSGLVMPTTHLSDEAVASPFLLILDSRTTVESPRMGGYWVSLQFGDRDNPKNLTEEERDYVAGVLKFALAHLVDSCSEDEILGGVA